MDIPRLTAFVTSRASIAPSVSLRSIIPADTHSDVVQYLQHLLPTEMYFASGIRVKTAKGIVEENAEGVAPGGYISPHGYLVVATSIGGNAVCIECKTGATFWADRSSFSDDEISYENRSTGVWVDLPFTAENVAKALVPVEYSLEVFIEKLLTDQLEDFFDELD